MSRRELKAVERRWPMREPFEISRGVQTDQPTVVVEMIDRDGFRGRGEACGVMYQGETPETMLCQIEEVRNAVEKGASRIDLLDLLPAGGARCALDSALLDLEAKTANRTVYSLFGIEKPQPQPTAFTIGIRSVQEYGKTAKRVSTNEVLKVKVAGSEPLSAIQAVHENAPNSKLIIDPNQAWSVDQIERYAPSLLEMNVVLLEQPLAVGEEALLDGKKLPLKLCADELIDTRDDLEKAVGRFDVINIKLDKTGGLTAAWELADAAVAKGFELMVGCMAGSSLSMAPAHVLAQRCAYVDLDGPLLQSEDWENGLRYDNGVVSPPDRDFWG